MTPHARVRFVLPLGVLGGAFVALAPACSLDWEVRQNASDGGGAESSLPDVTVSDTGLDVNVVDAPGDSGADCVALEAALGPAKNEAKKCVLGATGQCQTAVKSECGCDVVVKAAASAETTAYSDAVAALLAACGKPASCTACPTLPQPSAWGCLVNAGPTECVP